MSDNIEEKFKTLVGAIQQRYYQPTTIHGNESHVIHENTSTPFYVKYVPPRTKKPTRMTKLN